jgi:hypothetical protein
MMHGHHGMLLEIIAVGVVAVVAAVWYLVGRQSDTKPPHDSNT